jgi:hypothetical protein
MAFGPGAHTHSLPAVSVENENVHRNSRCRPDHGAIFMTIFVFVVGTVLGDRIIAFI